LDYQLSDEDFARHFLEWGKVKEAQIVRDPLNGSSRGFGFITFEDSAIARHLIE
jgi:RNA recognition motif-containing protein